VHILSGAVFANLGSVLLDVQKPRSVRKTESKERLRQDLPDLIGELTLDVWV
jgi:hypothetical protein